MPNSFLPSVRQGSADGKKGVILIGDSWNMRHPLAGGGMTVALYDVVLLRGLLSHVGDLTDWKRIRQVLYRWHWSRKPLTATVNILGAALHKSSFTRRCWMTLTLCSDEAFFTMRAGSFKYLERGGEGVNRPASLLSTYVNVALDDPTNFSIVVLHRLLRYLPTT